MTELNRVSYYVAYKCGCTKKRSLPQGPGTEMVIRRERDQAKVTYCPDCPECLDAQPPWNERW